MTKKQSDHVYRLVTLYADRLRTVEDFPPSLLAHLYLIISLIEDKIKLGKTEFAVLEWLLDMYFTSNTEAYIDPLAEQVYAKIVGHWPYDEPWYDRMLDHEESKNTERIYKLGT